MNNDLITKKDKSILNLSLELHNLRALSWNSPIVKLDNPYQLGYEKYLALREEVKHRKEAERFIHILKYLGKSVYCRNADFLDSKGKVIHCGFKKIGNGEWDKYQFPEYYKKYFYYGIVDFGNEYVHNWKSGYKFLYGHFFEEKVKPYIVTHQKMVIPEVESNKTKLQNKFEKENLWPRYNKLKHGSTYKYHDKNSYVNAKAPSLHEEYYHMEPVYGLDWTDDIDYGQYDRDNDRYIAYNNRYFTMDEFLENQQTTLENKIPL